MARNGATREFRSGKTKSLFLHGDDGTLRLHFTDALVSLERNCVESLPGKGATGARMTSYLFTELATIGIPTHFVSRLGPVDLEVVELQMIPLEVVVRFYCHGSFAGRFGIGSGSRLSKPTVESFLKSDELGDPMVNMSVADCLGILGCTDYAILQERALQVGAECAREFASLDIDLLDLKMEFGLRDGGLLLGDEIGFDTVRLRDKFTGQRLDKDIWYRQTPGVEGQLEQLSKRLASWGLQ